MNNMIKSFRDKILNGKYVYGPFMKTSDPMFIEAAGLAGFDFVILDTEHGPVSIESQQNNIRAAEARGLVPVIRLKDHAENTIGQALDIGASGVQVPQISTAEEAKRVVKFAKFYPYGSRGVCRFVRAAEYSAMDRFDYFESSKDILIILQLEGVDAINNLESILEVDGIDILFIGPYDLSQSLGIPGQVNSPLVVESMCKIVDKAKKKNKVIGVFVDTPEDLKIWRNMGIQYLSYSVDIGIFMEGCKTIMKNIKDLEISRGGGYSYKAVTLTAVRKAVA